MLCDQCGNAEATVHQIKVDDEITHVQLCEDCAGEQAAGSTSPTGDTVSEILSSLSEDTPAEASGDSSQCPECGTTLTEFRQAGRLGCSTCYETFQERIQRIIHRIHGSERHVESEESAPGGTGLGTVSPEQKLQLLEKRLQQKVDDEDYEEAALLRDRIQELEESRNDESAH